MKTIPLTQGLYAIVDDEDYEQVVGLKWHAVTQKGTNLTYAAHNRKTDKGWRPITMHVFLLGTEAGTIIDHKNRNGLDNRRHNLRRTTQKNNTRNKGKYAKGRASSRFKGVHWNKLRGKWAAQIQIDGRSTHIGLFSNEEAAARAYDSAAMYRFGEYASLNFPGKEEG